VTSAAHNGSCHQGTPGGNLNLGNAHEGSGTGATGAGITADGCDVKTDDVCAAQAYEGEAVPLDTYIMFDIGRLCIKN
jgi:hypothetical protein